MKFIRGSSYSTQSFRKRHLRWEWGVCTAFRAASAQGAAHQGALHLKGNKWGYIEQ